MDGEHLAPAPGVEWDPDYNFEHFRTRHFVKDVTGTIEARGIRPGALAPDFELPVATRGTIRLSDLRDKPVLLHFGSVT
jgi:hypothetical protein